MMIQAMRRQTMALLLGLLAASAAVPAPVSAASIVVGPGGFATIQQAVNNAAPGSAIVIAPGTYAENVDLSAMGSAVGPGNGNLALVARDGPGTVTLSGSGVKLSNSAAFDGTLIVDGLSFSSSDEDAIRLGSFTNLVVADCTFQTVGNNREDSGVEISLVEGDPQIVVLNNTFGLGSGTTTALGSALKVDTTGSAAPIITFEENTLSEPGPRPISFPRVFLTLLGAGGTITVRDNSFTDVYSSGIVAQLGEDGDKAVTISDNVMTNLQSVGISVVAAPGGAVDATITRNRLTNIAADAVGLETYSTVTANISNNQIVGASGSGIATGINRAFTTDAVADMAIEGNTITRAGRDGIGVLAAGRSTISALVRNNRIEQPATVGSDQYFGFSAASAPTGVLTLAISQNTFGADTLGRSASLAEETNSTTRIEGDSSANVEQNVSANNTVGGVVVATDGVEIVAPGTVAPPPAAPQLLVQDDSDTAFPDEPETIDVLGNDAAPAGLSLAFAAPISNRGGEVSATNSVSYTSPAAFQGSDELVYVARSGTVTSAGRVSVSVRRTLPRSPRSLVELHFLPLVGK